MSADAGEDDPSKQTIDSTLEENTSLTNTDTEMENILRATKSEVEQPEGEDDDYMYYDPVDVAEAVSIGHADDDYKRKVLLTPSTHGPWLNPDEFQFPMKQIGKIKRRFIVGWLTQHPWMRYSTSTDSAYCLYCLFYAPRLGRAKSFVLEPVSDWSNMHRMSVRHETITDIHSLATETANSILRLANPVIKITPDAEIFIENNTPDADTTVCKVKHRYQKILPSCTPKGDLSLKGLKPCVKTPAKKPRKKREVPVAVEIPADTESKTLALVQTLLLCSRHNIPFRCFDDFLDHFRSVMDFCSQVNQDVAAINWTKMDVLKVLDVAVSVVRNSTLSNIEKAKKFSVLFRELTGTVGSHIITVSVRYVHSEEHNIDVREEYLGFLEVNSVEPWTKCSERIHKILEEAGLNLKHMAAYSFDKSPKLVSIYPDASLMPASSQQWSRKTFCGDEVFNLCIARCCNVPLVKLLMETTQCIAETLHKSKDKIQVQITELPDSETKTNIVKTWESLRSPSWSSNPSAMTTFTSSYDVILKLLGLLAACGDVQARAYHASITRFDFLIALFTCERILGVLCPLSKFIITNDVDLLDVFTEVAVIVGVLDASKTKSEDEVWTSIYDHALAMAVEQGIQVVAPLGKNYSQETLVRDWRDAVYSPLVLHVANQLTEKVITKKQVLCGELLIPTKISNLNKEKIEVIYNTYQDVLTERDEFDREIVRWKSRCAVWDHSSFGSPKPQTPLTTLQNIPRMLYKNVHAIIQILVTSPVSMGQDFTLNTQQMQPILFSQNDNAMTKVMLLKFRQDATIDMKNVVHHVYDGNNSSHSLSQEISLRVKSPE